MPKHIISEKPLLDPDNPVTIGNKPKNKWKPKQIELKKGQTILLNLKPTVPSTPPRKPFVIKVRDFMENKTPEPVKKPYLFEIKLDLPENPNPFYSTEKHRQAFIQQQLQAILKELNLHYYGEVLFDEMLELISANGFAVELSIKEDS